MPLNDLQRAFLEEWIAIALAAIGVLGVIAVIVYLAIKVFA